MRGKRWISGGCEIAGLGLGLLASLLIVQSSARAQDDEGPIQRRALDTYDLAADEMQGLLFQGLNDTRKAIRNLPLLPRERNARLRALDEFPRQAGWATFFATGRRVVQDSVVGGTPDDEAEESALNTLRDILPRLYEFFEREMRQLREIALLPIVGGGVAPCEPPASVEFQGVRLNAAGEILFEDPAIKKERPAAFVVRAGLMITGRFLDAEGGKVAGGEFKTAALHPDVVLGASPFVTVRDGTNQLGLHSIPVEVQPAGSTKLTATLKLLAWDDSRNPIICVAFDSEDTGVIDIPE